MIDSVMHRHIVSTVWLLLAENNLRVSIRQHVESWLQGQRSTAVLHVI